MWYYALAAILLAEHLGRKFKAPRPSRLLRAVVNAVQPTVEWLAVCWADAMCFLTLMNMTDIWMDILVIARPLSALVGLPVVFCNAVDKRVLATRRPIAYLWGCVLVGLLAGAHFVYTMDARMLAADVTVVLMATYNCVNNSVKREFIVEKES